MLTIICMCSTALSLACFCQATTTAVNAVKTIITNNIMENK